MEGELEDPAKQGAHAQRLQELRAKGLGEGRALERQWRSLQMSPVITPNPAFKTRPDPGFEELDAHSSRLRPDGASPMESGLEVWEEKTLTLP